MKRWRVIFSLLALSLMMVMPAMAADYDLVINNGRVMDPETKYDAVANVGIKDGKDRRHHQKTRLQARRPSTPKGWWWRRDLSMDTNIALSPINTG